jgi:hypothetical protein
MFASAAATCLLFGWVLKNDDLHEWGLILTAGVWSMRMSLYVFDAGIASIGVWLSLAWIVGAVGSWLLEAYDHRWRFHLEKVTSE